MLRSTVLVALIALAADPVGAQVTRLPTRRIVSRGWQAPAAQTAAQTPTAQVPPAQTSDARAEADPVLSEPTEATREAAPVAPAPAAPARPTSALYGRTGLRAALPPGWASADDEARLPAYAVYTFTAPAGSPLAGVTLRAELLTGLNPAEEQGWHAGQARVGYHGARPVGPAQVPVEALVAVETAGPGLGGATAFVQRGRMFWAVSVVAPAATWARRRADVVALMAGVAFDAPTDTAPRPVPRTTPQGVPSARRN